jgi:hypothetical protein
MFCGMPWNEKDGRFLRSWNSWRIVPRSQGMSRVEISGTSLVWGLRRVRILPMPQMHPPIQALVDGVKHLPIHLSPHLDLPRRVDGGRLLKSDLAATSSSVALAIHSRFLFLQLRLMGLPSGRRALQSIIASFIFVRPVRRSCPYCPASVASPGSRRSVS